MQAGRARPRTTAFQEEWQYMRSLALSTFLFLALSLTVLADDMAIGRFVFDNPLGPTEITEIGSEAYSAVWPAGKPYKEAEVEMIVVWNAPDIVNRMKEEGANLYLVTLSSFMGLAGEPESVNKTLFFGSTSARRVYQSKVPRAHRANVFSKTLPDGSFVLIGVRSFHPHRISVGDLIQSIGNTFRSKE